MRVLSLVYEYCIIFKNNIDKNVSTSWHDLLKIYGVTVDLAISNQSYVFNFHNITRNVFLPLTTLVTPIPTMLKYQLPKNTTKYFF